MNILEDFKKIKTFVFDVDGVLTDGRVLLLENGLHARQMHVKDGLALQMAVQHNYNVVIISGGYSEPVLKRMQYLGIMEVYLAIKDKYSFLDNYFTERNIEWQNVLYMGDDLPDIKVLKTVGLSTCPSDAISEVKSISKYISDVNGGFGCVRDVIEKVLKLNDHWNIDSDISSK